jgi:hypothetical protein
LLEFGLPFDRSGICSLGPLTQVGGFFCLRIPLCKDFVLHRTTRKFYVRFSFRHDASSGEPKMKFLSNFMVAAFKESGASEKWRIILKGSSSTCLCAAKTAG